MICKGNFEGNLEDSINGSKESIGAYCVIVCEDANEWGALREAMRFRIMHLKKITRPKPKIWDFSNEIDILERMYEESD